MWTILTLEAIRHFSLNFYIPLSKVDENMKTAHHRAASRSGKFFFRKNIEKDSFQKGGPVSEEYELMTMKEIFHGKGSFPGTQYYLYKVIEQLGVDRQKQEQIKKYIDFVGQRASGELINNAEYLRKLVMSHPEYQHDSVVSHSINYDLIKTVHQIETGTLAPKELFGEFLSL